MAPGGDGVDHLGLRVLPDAADEVGAEAVGGVHPLGAQVVGHVHHGVELVLGDGDAVSQEQVVDQVLSHLHALPHEALRLVLGDAVGVVPLLAEGAVADIPLPVVLVGGGAVVLKLLDKGDALLAGGEGLHRVGR